MGCKFNPYKWNQVIAKSILLKCFGVFFSLMLDLLSNFIIPTSAPQLVFGYVLSCLWEVGRKNFFYLTTHSTHFIYGYMASDMVKDYSDSERRNPRPPHGLLFPISSKGSFICIIPQPLKHHSWSTGWNEKWLNDPTMKDRSDDTSHHERTLLPQSHMISSDFRQMIRTPKPLISVQFHYPV